MQINLGSYLIKKSDAIALSPIERHNDNNYYEYIKIPIINPYNMIYQGELVSDDWSEFRKNICHISKSQLNNLGSVLNVTLYPVQKDIYKGNVIYLSKDLYTGAQCSLNIYKENIQNNLELNLYFDDKGDNNPGYHCNLAFNENFKNLKQYYKDTYNMDVTEAEAELVVMDEDNIYRRITQEFPIDSKGVCFERYTKRADGKYNDKLLWPDWSAWRDGMNIKAYLNIKGSVGGSENANILTSNQIHFTKDQMRYFIAMDDEVKFDKKIILDNINMNIIDINCVNKIENKIIQVESAEQNKAGIIYPVFYSVKEAGNIILHRQVNENICINLNALKSKVKTFTLVINNDAAFVEFGRTANGVLFKVIGASLPEGNEGTYQILDENKNFVTLGHYTCI